MSESLFPKENPLSLSAAPFVLARSDEPGELDVIALPGFARDLARLEIEEEILQEATRFVDIAVELIAGFSYEDLHNPERLCQLREILSSGDPIELERQELIGTDNWFEEINQQLQNEGYEELRAQFTLFYSAHKKIAEIVLGDHKIDERKTSELRLVLSELAEAFSDFYIAFRLA